MRNWCQYTMKYLAILPKHIDENYHGNFHAGKVGFYWGPLSQDLRQWLPKKLDDLNKTKRQSLLIINVQHHNVARKMIVEYLKAFQGLTRQLKHKLGNDNDEHDDDEHDDVHDDGDEHDDEDDDDDDDNNGEDNDDEHDDGDEHDDEHDDDDDDDDNDGEDDDDDDDDDDGDDDDEYDDDGNDEYDDDHNNEHENDEHDDDNDNNGYDKNKIRIIYLSTVPNPATGERGPIYLTKALSKMTLGMMHSVGVETFDLIPMLYSVNDKSLDGRHYMTVTPSTGKVQGEFGPRVADAIMSYICS